MGRLISLWLILAVFNNFAMETKKDSLSEEERQLIEEKKREAKLSLQDAIAAHYEGMDMGALVSNPQMAAEAIWDYFLAKQAEKEGRFQDYGTCLERSSHKGFKIACKEFCDWKVENVGRCVGEIKDNDPEAKAVLEGLNRWVVLELVHSKLVEKEEPKKNDDPPEGMYN